MIEIVKIIYSWIETFFLIYLVIYSFFLISSVVVGSTTLNTQKRRDIMFSYLENDYYIPISIIIPAHNEELTVVDTILSLLYQKYKMFEIIVVDDGSTDNTVDMLIKRFNMTRIERPIKKEIGCSSEKAIYVTYDYRVPITLICKDNGGKADSLNLGICASKYPYVTCIDADSMLQNDALEKIARCAMESDDTIAVGGLVRVVNEVFVEKGEIIDYRLPKKLVLCMQVLEYDRSFLASRLLFDKFNGNLIVSGAFGLFRKDILLQMGGYNTHTIGEDMEIIVRMHAFARANNIPYNIRYASNAVCWTQVPASMKDLGTQRRRWHIGLMDSISVHKRVLFNTSYGMLSFISFTYFLIYEMLSPFIEIFGLTSIIIASFFRLTNVPFMLMLFGIYIVFNAIVSMSAFFSRVYAMNIKLSKIDIVKAVVISFIENIGLRLLLVFVRFSAILGYRKNKGQWGEIERSVHRKESKMNKKRKADEDDAR